MPKITLLNTDSGKLEDFEPIDAREILSNPETIYSVPEETRAGIGKELSPHGDINIPQLHGGDAEMQTGLSIEKYGRSQVVKALPGNPSLTPVSTSGGSLEGSDPRESTSEGLTVAEIKAEMDKKGIEYPANAKKAEYQKLLDDAK